MPSLGRAACLVVSLGLTWSSSALADPCGVRFVPPMNGTVPANAPALIAYPTPDGSDGGVPPALTVTGVRGPTTSSSVTLEYETNGPPVLLFDSDTPREVGPSSIDYTLDCGDAGDGGGGGAMSWPIVVGPAVPFPTRLGSPSFDRGKVGAVVTVTPSPELVAFAGLVRILVTVDDDTLAGVTSFDVIDGAPFTVTTKGNTISVGREHVDLTGVCTTSQKIETHTYMLSAEVVGTSFGSDPMPLVLDVACPQPSDGGLASSPPENSAPPADFGEDDDLVLPPTASGCAVVASERSPKGPSGEVVMLALALLCVKRRALFRRSWWGRFWGT